MKISIANAIRIMTSALFAIVASSVGVASGTPLFPSVTNEVLIYSLVTPDSNMSNNRAIDVNSGPPGESAIRLFKESLTPDARLGDELAWRIHGIVDFEYDLIAPQIMDILPPEQTFVPNSILPTINGQPAPANVQVGPGGFLLAFQTLPSGSTFSITFKTVLNVAIASDSTVNRAKAQLSPMVPVSNLAEATITIQPEEVFDCATLIGRVFSDRNANGYVDLGERGLAGTRLVALAGGTALSITVDAKGRYHLPCSVVPNAAIGSNIIVKLDTQTLPTGFRLTTENPRVVRATRGKTSKADFGVHLGRVVRMDLNDCLFMGDFLTGTAGTRAGLDRIVELLTPESAVLRIIYRTSTDDRALIDRRLRDVVSRIDRRWQAVGAPYELEIESEVVKVIGQGQNNCQ